MKDSLRAMGWKNVENRVFSAPNSEAEYGQQPKALHPRIFTEWIPKMMGKMDQKGISSFKYAGKLWVSSREISGGI